MKTPPICLSIAGNDPSGGAGIQADLKAFSALGCYGAAVITALTIQNTMGVIQSIPIPAETVYAQAATILEDFTPHTVKIGMTGNADIVRAIAKILRTYRPPFVVLDPIIVSSSGRRLLDGNGLAAMHDELMPLCDLITPNIPELQALTNCTSIERGAEDLCRHTGAKVLVKGGHADGEPEDILFSRTSRRRYVSERIKTRNDHGTGCTLSSAIAAYVARGTELSVAIGAAKDYVTEALRQGAEWNMGHGHGAMNHFFSPEPLIERNR